jgi:hypothetical protein
MPPPTQFYQRASLECREYLRENRDECREYLRRNYDDDLQEFRENMAVTLFGGDMSFHTPEECLAFIGNDARLIFDLVDYVADQDSNYGEPLSDTDLLSKFNYCMYFVGTDMILSDDGWEDIISAYRHWYDDDTDSEEDSSDTE